MSFQALYMVPVVLSVAMIAAFQLPAFTERQNLGAVTLLLVLYGSAYIRVPLPPEIFLSQDSLIRTSQSWQVLKALELHECIIQQMLHVAALAKEEVLVNASSFR